MKPEWEGHDYRSRCGACHLTGCNPYEKRFTEPGVGCEACHGPGLYHSGTEKPEHIIVPGRRGTPLLETCRRCHNSRNNHARHLKGFTGIYHAY